MAELAHYDADPTLYLFTSLTAGSSHIVTATSRIETILKANKIPFKGVDTATDDLARKLYGRRASGKKLPLLVKQGYVVGDLEMIEEWNEYGELKEALGVTSAPVKPLQAVIMPSQAPPKSPGTAAPAGSAAVGVNQKENTPAATPAQNLAIRQMGAEAAKAAAAKKPTPTKISTTNPLLAEKVNSPLSAGASTPKKGTASLGGILSPKSIPLPATPNPVTSSKAATPAAKEVAKKESSSEEEDDDEDDDDDEEEEESSEEDDEDEEDGRPRLPPATNQKPVSLPILTKGELDNPALNAGPISVTHKAPTPVTSPTGKQAIVEESEGDDDDDDDDDEDDDEDDDDDDDKEDEDEDEEDSSDEEEDTKPTAKETPTIPPAKSDTTAPTPVTTSTATTTKSSKSSKSSSKPSSSDKKKSTTSSSSKSKSKSSSSTSTSKSKTDTPTTSDKAKQKVKAVVKPKDSKTGKSSTSASGSKSSEKKSVKK